MCCSCLSGTIIILDKICDFIPFVSTATNLVDLVAKIALDILEWAIPSAYEAIKDFAPIQHLIEKKVSECIFLAIPFVNFIVAVALHVPKRYFSTSTSNQNQNVEEEPQRRETQVNRTQQETDERMESEAVRYERETRQKARREREERKLAKRQADEREIQEQIAILESYPVGDPKRALIEKRLQNHINMCRKAEETQDSLTKLRGIPV